MANTSDTKMMLTPRAQLLLGGLLAVVTLVGCGHLLISYEGAKIRPGHEIPIVAEEQQSGQYTTDDVAVDYTYRQTGDQLKISGRVLFADYLRLNYGLRYFHLSLVLADEGNNILRNYPLTSTGYGRNVTFDKALPLPHGTSAMVFAFTYTGQSVGGGDGGGPWDFWDCPIVR